MIFSLPRTAAPAQSVGGIPNKKVVRVGDEQTKIKKTQLVLDLVSSG